MSINFYSFASYLGYLINAGTRYSVHSPYVYKLIDEVIRDKQGYAAYRKISSVRHDLFKNPQLIEITEIDRKNNGLSISHRVKSVKSVARESSIDEKYGCLLYRLIGYFKPETVIETGTSFGLSTMYMAMANSWTKVYSIDACTIKSEQAALSFQAMGIENIEQHIGLFDVVLPGLVSKASKVDFAFIDGDYSFEGTISCFESLLSIAHNDTVFVFNKIHSTPGMENAWDHVTDHEMVTVSIDLFGMGIVFLKKELSRQNFVVRF